MSAVYLAIAILFFAVGFVGILLPVIPGIGLIWLGMLVYGFLTGFEDLSVGFLAGQASGVGLAFLVDYAANIWGVKRYGGSRPAVWGSILGLLGGMLLFGPLGVIIGPFAGALAGELITGSPISRAARSGIGTLVGFLGGTLLKFIIAVVMVVWFFTVIL